MNDLFKIADFLSIAIVVVLVGFLSTFLIDLNFIKEDAKSIKKSEIKRFLLKNDNNRKS